MTISNTNIMKYIILTLIWEPSPTKHNTHTRLTVRIQNKWFSSVNILVHVFAISSPILAQRKPISSGACDDIKFVCGLIQVMIRQIPCNGLFFTYLIQILDVHMLFIKLWLLFALLPHIITPNFCIIIPKKNHIRDINLLQTGSILA